MESWSRLSREAIPLPYVAGKTYRMGRYTIHLKNDGEVEGKLICVMRLTWAQLLLKGAHKELLP